VARQSTEGALLKAPGALCRHGARLRNWVFDAESKPVRMDARERRDFKEYMALREARNEAVRRRMGPVMVGVVVLLAIVYLAITFVAPFWNWTTLVLALTLVGWFGAPKDKPVAGRAVDSAKAPRLTSAMIEDALCSLGIGGLNQAYAKGKRIEFPSPIIRDGDGWRADIDLLPGVTASDVIERREKLSSGLRRQIGCVWPEGDLSFHEGRLVLWVGDKNMTSSKQPVWPLGKPGAVVPAPAVRHRPARPVGAGDADVRLRRDRRDPAHGQRSRCGNYCSSPHWTRARCCMPMTSKEPVTSHRSRRAHTSTAWGTTWRTSNKPLSKCASYARNCVDGPR
jgi:hypothetical protein